jgi:hypothetical protein
MNVLRNPRYNTREKLVVAGTGILALLLSACGGGIEVDDTPASETDATFIASARNTIVYAGKAGEVVQIQDALRDEYADYPLYDNHSDLSGDQDNALAFTPRRFNAAFSEGDGSGADTVCDELRVPETATYVQATTRSDKPSWLFYNAEKDIAYLCYPPNNNPDDVMVWAGNQPR